MADSTAANGIAQYSGGVWSRLTECPTCNGLSGPVTSFIKYDDGLLGLRRAALALVKGGRWKPLRIIWSARSGSDEFLRKGTGIELVEQSPDGESVAVVSALSHAETDYYWTSRSVDVLPLPR